MENFLKTTWKGRLFVGFLVAALLILFVGAVGVWGSFRISQSFEQLEEEVIQEIVRLEEIRSTLSLTLLEVTTFLFLRLPSPEAEKAQALKVMNYWYLFEDALSAYNQRAKKPEVTSQPLNIDNVRMRSLVEAIIKNVEAGLPTEEILPYKKELKALEEETVFPVIQQNIDAATERLASERIHNQTTVKTIFLLIVFSGGISISLILLLGFRIARRERLVDQFREQLISIVSHQLKAPLTIISGHAELLDEGELSKENKETVESIKSTAKNMNVLIQDLLDLSRIDQGKFITEKKRVDVCATLTEIVDTLQPLARDNDVKIKFKKPQGKIFIKTDRLKIKQALQNVIDNGIKYNKKGGVLSVELYKEGKWLSLAIKDEGIGVPKGEEDMLFKRFYRASNSKQKIHSGTGLGLFIAQEIIHQSGGKITFESIENKGTTFHISIPLI